MRKYLIFLTSLILIDIFICLSVNADLLGIQKDYDFYNQSLTKLRKKNDQLVREVAHLSSLNRISRMSQEMGLTKNKEKVVFISQDQFAMR